MNHLKQLELNHNNEWVVLDLDMENPYLFIHSIDLSDKIKEGDIYSIKIEYQINYYDNSTENNSLNAIASPFGDQMVIDKEISLIGNIENVSIKFSTINETNVIATLNYQIQYFLNEPNATSDFKLHLSNTINTKILFSAPFGEGKSTFLDYFFEENEKEYEVFKVYPVNYSVASNEDIFRYIKTDLLFQLLGKDVEFDKEEISKLLSIQQFILSKPKEVLASLLKIAISLTLPNSGISKSIEYLDDIINKVNEFNSASGTDDFEKAKEYLEVAYEKEGSIYEDNFYTQLIRQLVNQFKIKKNKKTVLVIEDLDRMDPEHIFRILNVISAHYDAYSQYDNEYHNKFGFDKIIIVCHIDNIRSVFEHRYGEKTDFKGYINKFYSSQIYKFDYKKVAHSLIDEFVKETERWLYSPSFKLLKVFINTKLLTLRDLIKLKPSLTSVAELNSIQGKIESEYNHVDYGFINGFFTIILFLLVEYFEGTTNLISKLSDMKQKKILTKMYEKVNYTKFLLASLPNQKDTEQQVIIPSGNIYSYRRIETSDDIRTVDDVKINNEEATPEMIAKDFIEILILNVKVFENN